MTVAEFADLWLQDVKASSAKRTHEYYRNHVEKHIKPHLGANRLDRVKPLTVRGFFSALAAVGVSSTLQHKVGVSLGVMLASAVDLNLIPHNPARDVKKPRREVFQGRTWTAEELRAFLKGAANDRFRALFILAADSGMRLGELLGLQWQDVDFAGNAVNVCRAVSAGELKDPKTAAGRRRIPLSRPTLAALQERRKVAVAEGHYSPEVPVFCSRTGGVFEGKNLYHRHFVPAMKRAGVPTIRFHDIRHSAATLLLAGGVDLATVSARLGHASRATTISIYTHATDQGQQKAVDFMGKAISG